MKFEISDTFVFEVMTSVETESGLDALNKFLGVVRTELEGIEVKTENMDFTAIISLACPEEVDQCDPTIKIIP